MANIFKLFKQTVFPVYLGVDIGTTSIKIAEVRQGDRLPEILNYGILEASGYLVRANQALQASNLKIFESEVVEFLKLLVKKMKPRSTEAAASLPPFSAFMTVLDFPEMSPGDLEKALVYQAKQYVPLPLSEVKLDYSKVGEFTDEKGFRHQQILLISVPLEQVEGYRRIFKLAGLKLVLLETENLSLARIFGGTDPTPTMIVDIGSRSTGVSFLENGQFKFSVQSDFAGASLTQAVSSSLSINPLRAEEIKKEKGVLGTGANYELSTIMLPFLDAIINDVKKALYNYQAQFPSAPKAERIILSGGGANLLGIEKYFEKELSVPTVKAAPFAKFEYRLDLEPLVGELNPLLSVALGLTLKEIT